MADTDATKKPFHVRTSGGAFVSGHDTQNSATKDAAIRNERAAALKLTTTYKVVPLQ